MYEIVSVTTNDELLGWHVGDKVYIYSEVLIKNEDTLYTVVTESNKKGLFWKSQLKEVIE